MPRNENLKRQLAAVIVVAFHDGTGLPGQAGPSAQALRHMAAERGGQVIQATEDHFLGVFMSVTVAVQVAVAMLRSHGGEDKLDLRIGISAGPVQLTPVQCSGSPVSEAYRLRVRCSQSSPALTSLGVPHLLAEKTDGPAFHPHQGQAYAMDWQPAPAVSDPPELPSFLSGHDDPMVGRETEIARFGRLLGGVEAGEPAWVAVCGDAGIGKTRLLAEFARVAFARGMSVIGGAAHEGLSKSYASLHETLRNWVAGVDDLALQAPPGLGELSRLIPDIRERVYGLHTYETQDPEADQRRLFAAVGNWLRFLAQERPVVLMLDSLHWEGATTDRMLEHLIAPLSGERVAVVVTYRQARPGLQAVLSMAREQWGEFRTPVFDLEQLSFLEVTKLLKDRRVSSELAKVIHLVTEGRPLHVLHLLESGTTASQLPDTVEQALSARIEELPSESREVLRAAAVVGAEFSARAIDDVLGGGGTAYGVLDTATSLGILRLAEQSRLRYQFSHSLIRRVICDQIGKAKLAQLHARAGEALLLEHNNEGVTAADLARLFCGALSLGYRANAIEWTTRAAESALSQFANEDAATMFKLALDLLPQNDGPEACRLVTGLGVAYARLGDSRSREVLYRAADIAERLGNGALMAQAMLATYRMSFSRARYVDEMAVNRLRTAAHLLTDQDQALKARILALLALELTWAEDRDESLALSDEAMRIAQDLETEVMAEVLSRRQWVSFHPLTVRLQERDQLAAAVAQLSDPTLKFEAAGHEVLTSIRCGERPRLDRAMQVLRTSAAQSREPNVKAMLLLREANVALMDARYEDSAAYAKERFTLVQEAGQVDGWAAFQIQWFWIQYDCATYEELQTLASKMLANLDTQKADAWPVNALVAAECGESEVVNKITSALRNKVYANDQIYLWSMALLTPPAIYAGDKELLDQLLQLQIPHRDEHANMVFCTVGPVSRYLGLLRAFRGDRVAAEADFRHAIVASREIGALSWHARAQCDLAELLLTQTPHPTEAQSLLDEVCVAAARYRWPRILTRAEQLKTACA